MNATATERTLILATRGRDASVARNILAEAHLAADICSDVNNLVAEIARGAEVAVVTEEALNEIGRAHV